MNANETIIHTKNLTRLFKQRLAVDNLSLDIRQGELFGLIGPDGAGKTTTLRLLAGLLDVSDGSIQIGDIDLVRQPETAKPMIGYMAQQFNLYSELTVIENLIFFADLFDVNRNTLPERMERLLSFAGLSEFKSRRAAHLSGGMQKKLALACTLIHEPDILLLDEPTTGVDPISRREFWDILGELHLRGTTIVVSTPYMDEADRCSRVGLMYNGKLMICASPQEIRQAIKGELIEIHTENWRFAREIVQQIEGVLEVQTYGEAIHLLVDSSSKRKSAIKKALLQEGIKQFTLREAPVRMEEAFISLIRNIEV